MIIMDLQVKPTIKNVVQLKTYVKGLPNKSPYKSLVQYEQQLLDTGKSIRALARICNSDNHQLVNKIENLTNENWFRVSNLTDIADIPNNYFDIVLWSGCDIESELRQIIKIYPKLKASGRVYFDNLLYSFGALLKQCLDGKDIQTLFGQKLSKVLEESLAFAQLVQAILASIFTAINKDYSVQLLEYGGKRYIVFIKGHIKFTPSASLSAAIAKVDQDVAKKFPPEAPLQLSTKRVEKIRNKIFDLVAKMIKDSVPVKKSTICKQLISEKLVVDCKTKAFQKFLKDDHLTSIQDALEVVDDQIDSLIATQNIKTVQGIIDNLGPIADPDVADEEHWDKYIRRVATEKFEKPLMVSIFYDGEWSKPLPVINGKVNLEPDNPESIPIPLPAEEFVKYLSEESETETETETESESELESEEEFYPEIEAPEEKLPAILLPGLSNVGGFSCFMDSVLFTILLPETGYFADNMLNKQLTKQNARVCTFFKDKTEGLEYLEAFQYELVKLANIMRGNQEPELTCYPILQQMSKCNQLTKTLMSKGQQDDSEFLRALMQIFHLEPTKIVVSRAVSNDKQNWIKTSTKKEKQAILEIHLPKDTKEMPELISWFQKIEINDYKNVSKTEWHKGPGLSEKRYRYAREKYTIRSSDALIFHVARRQVMWLNNKAKYVKNTQPIQFEEYIEEKPNKHFGLQTVTIHHGGAYGGHYTAYFKYGTQWFYYDDTAVQRVRIADWDEVVNVGSVSGSLFMYYPIQ